MDQIEALTARTAERRAWNLADALVARRSASAAATYLQLRAQGERLPTLVYWMTRRLRQALEVVDRLDSGEPPAQVKRGLRMPTKAADRFLADARGADRAALRLALEQLAALELDSRGGRALPEDTAALRAILAVAA